MSSLMNFLGITIASLIASAAFCQAFALETKNDKEQANSPVIRIDSTDQAIDSKTNDSNVPRVDKWINKSERLGGKNYVEIIYEQQIKLNIASLAMNRIHFDKLRVIKLIGNTSGFNSILSDDGQDLFISSKLPEGKKIDFSALLASGDILDFSLSVVKSHNPRLIKLKLANDNDSGNRSEANSMIHAMSLDIIDKYYVQTIRKKIKLPHIKDIQLVQNSSYRFGDLYGSSFTFKTKLGSNIALTPAILAASFNGVVAAHVEPDDLSSNVSGRAFIVFRGSR